MSGSDGNDVCPPPEADGNSDELVDLQTKYRESCKKSKECSPFGKELETCNTRVKSKTKTAETCMEEVIDYMHCVDHCAAKKFFPRLK